MHLSKDEGRLRADRPRADVRWTATGHERPVFLDERGRRRRWMLVGGALAGAASTLWLAALLAGAVGFSTLPAPAALTLHARSHRLAAGWSERRQDVAVGRQDVAVGIRREVELRRTAASVRRVVDRA